MTSPSLPWASLPWKRCRAVLPPGPRDPLYGRCDLAPHGEELDHALERGMIIVRWPTPARWDGPEG